VDGRNPAQPWIIETLELMGCLPPFSTGDSDFATIHSMYQMLLSHWVSIKFQDQMLGNALRSLDAAAASKLMRLGDRCG